MILYQNSVRMPSKLGALAQQSIALLGLLSASRIELLEPLRMALSMLGFC